MKKIVILLVLGIIIVSNLSAQQNRKEANNLYISAVNNFNIRKYKEAIDLLNQAIKLDSTNVNYYYELGSMYFDLNQPEKAIEVLESISASKKKIWEYYYLLGISNIKLKRNENALQILNIGIENYPSDDLLITESGIALFNLLKYDSAIVQFKKSISLNPNEEINYTYLFEIYKLSNIRYKGLIYGEMFLNICTSSPNKKLISHKLYLLYESEISNYLLGKQSSIFYEPKVDTNALYMNLENEIKKSLIGVKKFDFGVLLHVRNAMLNYISSLLEENEFTDIFNYINDMDKNNFFDIYNFYIFRYGNPDFFSLWQRKNEKKWSEFMRYKVSHEYVITNK